MQVLSLPARGMSASRSAVHLVSRVSVLTIGPNVSVTVHTGRYPLENALLRPAAVQLVRVSTHRKGCLGIVRILSRLSDCTILQANLSGVSVAASATIIL